jgi:hypothetical protein
MCLHCFSVYKCTHRSQKPTGKALCAHFLQAEDLEEEERLAGQPVGNSQIIIIALKARCLSEYREEDDQRKIYCPSCQALTLKDMRGGKPGPGDEKGRKRHGRSGRKGKKGKA